MDSTSSQSTHLSGSWPPEWDPNEVANNSPHSTSPGDSIPPPLEPTYVKSNDDVDPYLKFTPNHGLGRYRCLCGHPEHTYKECHALNPYTRRRMWVMTKRMVTRINKQLHRDPKLRKYILSLGYEYYRPVQLPTPEPKNPLNKLDKLPVELIEIIIEWTYAITLSELPSAHPLVASNGDIECEHQRFGPLPVINLPPRKTARYGSWAREWLRRHPGCWGPLFQVMYVSKLFYEVGKKIRYREVHVLGRNLDYEYRRDDLCQRLTTPAILKEVTKHIHLTVNFFNNLSFVEVVAALATLPKLRHLCVTLKIDQIVFPTGKNLPLLEFFNLPNIETLSFIWVWDGDERQLTIPYDFFADHMVAPIPSRAEFDMQEMSRSFMRHTYQTSSWFDEASYSEDRPILPGKTRASRDWVAKKLPSRGFVQWQLITFAFKASRAGPPSWNLDKSPHNHPDQLNKMQREANLPLRNWRKGFEPYQSIGLSSFGL